MLKIKKLEFFNSPKSNSYFCLDVDLSKQFFILTGYNGAGKSRIINIISEVMSTIRGAHYHSSLSRWVFQGTLSDDSRVRSIKMELGGATREEVNNLSKGFDEVDLELSTMYERTRELVERRPSARYTTDDSKDVEKHFCVAGTLVEAERYLTVEEKEAHDEEMSFISYIDETIHFNFPQSVVEMALKGKEDHSNLDKTLWVLIHVFISRQISGSHIDKIISNLAELNQDGDKLDWSDQKLQEMLKNSVTELKNSANFESSPVFMELNKFYGMTRRKVVWQDDTIQMIVPNEGSIPFMNFSKGEKTLLAIALTVYLHRDSSVFLFDEPDLSLHVEWQRMLLPALQRLAPNAQFIIGTHSPFLIMQTQSETVVNLAKKFKEANI